MPRRRTRCKPDSNHGNRIRSSPQSSLEIQVSGADVVSVGTVCTAGTMMSAESSQRGHQQHRSTEMNGRMVLPSRDFLHLLKSVGAEGESAICGELFTVKQLCFFLKEYIKNKQLYDSNNPLLVHCEKDPLGKIFGVKSFTFQDTLSLVMKNILILDSSFTRKRYLTSTQADNASRNVAVSCSSKGNQKDNPSVLLSSHHPDTTFDCHDNINQVTSTTTITVTPCTPGKQNEEDQLSQSLLSSNAVKQLFSGKTSSILENEQRDQESGEIKHPGTTEILNCQENTRVQELFQLMSTRKAKSDALFVKANRKRRRTKSDHISENLPRRCSFSKYNYSDEEVGKSSQSWCFEVDLADLDSDETIYSIQSKETAYVKDSSDDLWFLEEDELSVDFQSTPSDHFQEEYELETEVDSNYSNENGVSDSSESPCELVVVYDDSDVQFWADSESESESTDEELMDKWKCGKCGTRNQPLSRHCSRCWNIRSGWLPDCGDNTSSQNEVSADPVKGDVKLESHSSSGERHDLPDVQSGLSQSGANRSYLSKNIIMERFLSSQPDVHSPKPLPVKTNTSNGHLVDNTSTTETASMQSDVTESDVNTELFKVPAAFSASYERISQCSAKGRLLPQLKLPSDDSGNGSLTSSQESTSSMHNSGQEISSTSPLKKPRLISQVEKIPASPRKCPLSPYRHYSPFPVSPYSAKQNLFEFDHLVSPGKRLCQTERQLGGLSSGNVTAGSNITTAINSSPLKVETSRRIFFVDSLPSPKKRAPNGTEYSDLCMICLSKPKEASIIHGKTGHQVCCYLCAKRLRRRGKPCPVCRRHIQKVVKNYVV